MMKIAIEINVHRDLDYWHEVQDDLRHMKLGDFLRKYETTAKIAVDADHKFDYAGG